MGGDYGVIGQKIFLKFNSILRDITLLLVISNFILTSLLMIAFFARLQLVPDVSFLVIDEFISFCL